MKRYLSKALAGFLVAIMMFANVAHVMAGSLDGSVIDQDCCVVADYDVEAPEYYVIHEDGGITFIGGEFAGMTLTAEEFALNEAELAMLYELGAVMPLSSVSIRLPITGIFMDGQSWSNQTMYASGTIGSVGSLLTSFTMAAAYLGGPANPLTVNNDMRNAGHRANAFSWQGAADTFGFGLTLRFQAYTSLQAFNNNRASFNNTVRGALALGRPTVAFVMTPGSGSGSHGVIIYGWNGSDLLIRSPHSSRTHLRTVQDLVDNEWWIQTYGIFQGPPRPSCQCGIWCGCTWWSNCGFCEGQHWGHFNVEDILNEGCCDS